MAISRKHSARRLFFWLVPLALALFHLTPPAEAASPAMPPASFDCAAAPGAEETVICSDPLLRQADHDLGTAYLAARNAAPDADAKAALRSDERSWIVQRNGECRINKTTVLTGDNTPRFVDCFLDEYGERHADLVQMAAHPERSPAAISHPIRKSFAGTVATGPPTPLAAVFIDLPDHGAPVARLGWTQDGKALALAGGALFVVDHGAPKLLAQLPDAAAYARLCPLGQNETLLVSADGQTAAAVDPQGHVKTMPPGQLPPGCGGAVHALAADDGKGDTLNFGPITTGATPAPRFVTVSNPAGTRQVSPPVRIDSRYRLAALYAPFLGQFVIAPASWPAGMDSAWERRWSKTGCAAFWQIDPQTAAATQNCIPFGAYATAAPAPLPTAAGLFFYVFGSGLYTVAQGAGVPYLTGNVPPPTVSPNGCKMVLAPASNAALTYAPKNQPIPATTGGILIIDLCGQPHQ